ncbi:MAG TPA: MFS transporter [Rhizomicrobium sp.]|jgi:MFS family permease|nr:MFS transporter [Rhizomicrobium sp.]
MRRSAPFPVLFFAGAAHGMHHVLLTLYLTLVLVIGTQWHLPYTVLIALWVPGTMLVGLGAPLAGWLADRWGETRMLVLCFLCLGASAIIAGLAHTPLQLEGALALLGLSGSIYHPVGFAWVVKHAEVRGRAIAATGIAGSIGVASGPIVAGGLATLAGWRTGFILPGAVTAALGVLLYWYYATGRIADRAGDAVEATEAPSRADMTRAFAVMAVTMTITLVIYSGFGTALPKLVAIGTHVGRYGFFAIGLAVGAIQLAGASAQFAGGHFADRGHAKRAYLGGFAMLCAVLPLVAVSTGWSLAAAAVGTVLMFEWLAPIETAFLARYTPASRRGLVFGIRYGLAAIGTPAGVWLVARLYTPVDGFLYLLMALAACSAVALVFAVFLPADGTKIEMEIAEPGAALTAGE